MQNYIERDMEGLAHFAEPFRVYMAYRGTYYSTAPRYVSFLDMEERLLALLVTSAV